MTDSLKLKKMEMIHLINNKTSDSSALKIFLLMLKKCGNIAKINFSYIGNENVSYKKESLFDYIVSELALSSNSFTDLEKYIEKTGNLDLKKLFITIKPHLKEPARTQSKAVLKIATIVRAILLKRECIFIDSPEESLSENDIFTFLKALEYELKSRGISIVLHSNNLSLLFLKRISDSIIVDETGFHQASNIKKPIIKLSTKTNELGLEFTNIVIDDSNNQAA